MYFAISLRVEQAKSIWSLLDVGRIFTARQPYIDGDYQNKDIHDTHHGLAHKTCSGHSISGKEKRLWTTSTHRHSTCVPTWAS